MTLPTFWSRTIVAIGSALLLGTSAFAGTNDLFFTRVQLQCEGADSTTTLGNKELYNLAYGHPLKARIPGHLRIGLQCNCQTLQMHLVVYDPATLETVAGLAAFAPTAVHSDGSVAHVSVAEGVESFAGGDSQDGVIRLDNDGCAAQATLNLNGQFELATVNGPITLQVKHGRLRTSGRQLRPVEVTGSGNYYSLTDTLVMMHLSGNGNSVILSNAGAVINLINSGAYVSSGHFGGGFVSNRTILVSTSLIATNGGLFLNGGGTIWSNNVINVGNGALVINSSLTNGLHLTGNWLTIGNGPDGNVLIINPNTIHLDSLTVVTLCTNSLDEVSLAAAIDNANQQGFPYTLKDCSVP